jgi:hypothetical protein
VLPKTFKWTFFYSTGNIFYYTGSIVIIPEYKLFGYWKKKNSTGIKNYTKGPATLENLC